MSFGRVQEANEYANVRLGRVMSMWNVKEARGVGELGVEPKSRRMYVHEEDSAIAECLSLKGTRIRLGSSRRRRRASYLPCEPYLGLVSQEVGAQTEGVARKVAGAPRVACARM